MFSVLARGSALANTHHTAHWFVILRLTWDGWDLGRFMRGPWVLGSLVEFRVMRFEMQIECALFLIGH